MKKKLESFGKLFEKEQHLIGASIVRLGLGSIISLFYLLHIFQKEHYWGPNGVYPFTNFVADITQINSFSLYQLSDSNIYFNIIFFTGLIFSILYTLGVKTRIIGILNFIFVWSLYQRNPFVLDGGNNILIICLFFLLFANVGAHFTFFKKTKRRSNRFLAALHNVSIIAVIVQVAILYFFSGIYKAQGDMWFNGISLYYILQVSEFTLPSVAEYIYSSPIILTIGTYSTVVFQIAFPFLILNKWTKLILVPIMIMFHLGIAIVMGLVSFGLTMICLDLLLFSDYFYIKSYQRYKVLRRKLGGKFRLSAVSDEVS